MTRRKSSALLASALLGVLAACGGGSGGGTTTPTQTGPTQARITVAATAPLVTFSPRVGFTYRVSVPSTITETAGLGANMNFVRLRQIYLGAEVERSEISSADLIAATGSNRLTASSTRTINMIFDVNDPRATSGILTFNFTDDRGNVQSVDFTITY